MSEGFGDWTRSAALVLEMSFGLRGLSTLQHPESRNDVNDSSVNRNDNLLKMTLQGFKVFPHGTTFGAWGGGRGI